VRWLQFLARAGIFVGPVVTVGTYLLDGWHLLNLGLPSQALEGLGALIFFLSVGGLLYRWKPQAAIPVFQPSVRPASSTPQPQQSQIETGDLSELIELCWNDHVPGSVLARETHAFNVAHAMKEDLKLRLREFLEAIRLIVGEGAPFDKFTESLYTRNHLIQIAVTARRTATNCRVILEHITGPLSSRCPIIIRANFTINAGDTEYVSIAEFAERLNTFRPAPSEPGLIQVHFPINPLSDENHT
jgi:hypothetical protein